MHAGVEAGCRRGGRKDRQNEGRRGQKNADIMTCYIILRSVIRSSRRQQQHVGNGTSKCSSLVRAGM